MCGEEKGSDTKLEKQNVGRTVRGVFFSPSQDSFKMNGVWMNSVVLRIEAVKVSLSRL